MASTAMETERITIMMVKMVLVLVVIVIVVVTDNTFLIAFKQFFRNTIKCVFNCIKIDKLRLLRAVFIV